MPLSEEEQRLLDEMERNLYGASHDVHPTRSGGSGLSSRGILFGFVGVLLGLGALVLGVALQALIVGVLGFALMLAGVVAALSIKNPTHSSHARSNPRATTSKNSSGKRSFMQRLEDRWDDHPGR